MNLEKLPETSVLRQLLGRCQYNHEIEKRLACDGAIIVECFDCPWKRVLDLGEEEIVRGEDVPVEAVAAVESHPMA